MNGFTLQDGLDYASVLVFALTGALAASRSQLDIVGFIFIACLTAVATLLVVRFGRNALSWDDKFKLDVWYVDNRSFWLDLKIIAMTVDRVLRRSGISAEGEATSQPFMGNAKGNGDAQ